MNGCISLLACFCIAETEPPSLHNLNFVQCPIDVLIEEYGRLTGSNVEIVKYLVGPAITLSAKTQTTEQATHLIKTELEKCNVGLFQIASNRFVATWIDPSRNPPRAVYAIDGSARGASQTITERLRQRREALERLRNAATNPPVAYTGPTNAPGLTAEERMKRLREYNAEIIRAQGAKGPPLPIQLTPEEDAQLVKDGILAPMANRPDAMTAAPADPPPMAPEERTGRLRKYNQELIRAKGAKGPPLPIQLTPEEDAQLVREGILPPMTNRPAATAKDPTNSPAPPAER